VKDFIQTMVKPDWDDNPRKSEILYAANLLEVGEFQFLQLAYKQWFDEELPEHLINTIFRDYTIKNIIPNWARHYARTITHLDNTNQLNSEDPKYHIYDVEFGEPVGNKGLAKFIMVTFSITTFFIFAFYLAIITVDEPTSLLPPYFEKKNIYPELYHQFPKPIKRKKEKEK
jgi:hypothetical protein